MLLIKGAADSSDVIRDDKIPVMKPLTEGSSSDGDECSKMTAATVFDLHNVV